MKIALQWEQASRDRISEAQALRVMGDIVEQIHGKRIGQPTVVEYSKQWLKRKEGQTEDVTMLAYRSALKSFSDHLGDKVHGPLHHVSTAQITEWRDASASKATARTANNKAKIIRTLFQSAWKDGLLTENPAAKIDSLKTVESLRRPFTLKELRTILGLASAEWKGMILVGLYTGQRLRDCASLRWNNVDLERGEIRLTTSKTGRRQFVPLSKPLREYFESLPTGDDSRAPIFPTLQPFTAAKNGSARLSHQFYELLVDAGLATPRPSKSKSQGIGRDGTRKRSEITFHCLRHTATSLLKAAGVSESVTRDIIGHDSAEVSANYTHTSDESRREAIEKLPDITK